MNLCYLCYQRPEKKTLCFEIITRHSYNTAAKTER